MGWMFISIKVVGVGGLFVNFMICRYGFSYSLAFIFVIFLGKAIALCIMVINPPLVGAYCMYGHHRHVTASNVFVVYEFV